MNGLAQATWMAEIASHRYGSLDRLLSKNPELFIALATEFAVWRARYINPLWC